jgi:hypothetical protein
MVLKLIVNEEYEDRTTIEQEIEKTRSFLEDSGNVIGVLYGAIERKLLDEGPLRELIVGKEKTKYQFRSSEELISALYTSDKEEEFLEEEFQDVSLALSLGLSEYYKKRLSEITSIPEKYQENDIANFFDHAITANYPNPNDFIIEYDKFKTWHEESEEPLKTRAMSFWLDILFEYGNNSCYLEKLVETEETLKLAKQHLPFKEVRESIDKLNEMLNE